MDELSGTILRAGELNDLGRELLQQLASTKSGDVIPLKPGVYQFPETLELPAGVRLLGAAICKN